MLSQLVSLLLFVGAVAAQGRAFYKPVPRPLAIKYITSNAEEGTKKRTGDKATPFAVEDLPDAALFKEPIPGTTFVLAGGTYRLGQVLKLPLHLSGSESNPVVVMANPGDRVTIEGKVEINANYLWLMGIEITDPMDLDKASAALLLRGNHSRVINCFVHETARGHGIVSPSGSTGQVIYGNVVSRTGLISARTTEDPADGVRVGNAVALHGVKYVADNVFVGFNSLCDKCRGFAAHADPSSSAEFAVERASGVVLEGNIFERSQATVGGYGAPAEQNVVNENFFAASELQIGQAAPTQAEVTGNLIAWSYLDSRYVWADSDPAYGSPSKPTVIRGNTVWFAPVDGDLGRMDDLPVLDLGTAAYVSATDKEKAGARPLLGAAPLPASLVVDGNTYGGPSTFFRLNAGGVKSTAETIADWRALTMRAGKQVDGASSVAKAPESGAHVVVRKNVYSPYRVHVVVFNYGNATNATVPLDSFVGLAMPMKFAVYKSAEQWGGKPVAEGALPSTAVDVPLSVNELVVSFVIVANAGKDPNFPPKCLDPTSAECDACPRFDDGCLDGKCRAGECLTTSLVCNRGGFCEEKASQSTTSASTATLSTLALLAAWTARLF